MTTISWGMCIPDRSEPKKYLKAWHITKPLGMNIDFYGWVVMLPDKQWYVVKRYEFPRPAAGPFESLDAAKAACILMEATNA